MESSLCTNAGQQLDRFCRQYLQVQLHLDYPSEEYLRQYDFQQVIYSRLFADNAVRHLPPARHQLRVLKELVKRIENAIQDWEEEVGKFSLWHFIQCGPFALNMVICST